MNYYGELLRNSKEMCNVFAEFFSKSYTEILLEIEGIITITYGLLSVAIDGYLPNI